MRRDGYHRLTSTGAYGYELNAKDQRTKLTLPGGKSWAYAYDDLGQVTGLRLITLIQILQELYSQMIDAHGVVVIARGDTDRKGTSVASDDRLVASP